MTGSFLKKSISLLALAGVLSSAVPAKQAEAGLLLMGGAAIMLNVPSRNLSDAVGKAVTGVAMTIAGAPLALAGGITAFFIPAVGLPILLLDADGSISQDQLEKSLAAHYSFIENREVISDLAGLIKAKAAGQTPGDGKIMVSISRDEIMSIIGATDLMETHPSDVAAMIDELK